MVTVAFGGDGETLCLTSQVVRTTSRKFLEVTCDFVGCISSPNIVGRVPVYSRTRRYQIMRVTSGGYANRSGRIGNAARQISTTSLVA